MKLLDLNNGPWQQSRPECNWDNNICKFSGYQSLELTIDSIVPKNNDLIVKSNLLRPYLKKIINNDVTFLDLGCANFYFGFLSRIFGAKKVTGVEIDKEYLNIINNIINKQNLKNINIIDSNIQDYNIPHDIVNASAIIHWLYSCSALFGSLENVIKYLADITNRVLFVEWIDNNDAAINQFGHINYNNQHTKKDYNKENFLINLNKYFNHVTKIGNTNPTRELYIAEKIVVHDDTYSGSIECSLSQVIKTFNRKSISEGCLSRELHWLSILKDFDRIPDIYDYNQNSITMEYMGERLDKNNIPDDWEGQIVYIANKLKKYDCCHNDIKPEEILVKNGKLNLVDFGWSTNFNAPIPSDWSTNIGEAFRYGIHDFNDLYSLKKSLNFINDKRKKIKLDRIPTNTKCCKIIATYAGGRRSYPESSTQALDLINSTIEYEQGLDPGVEHLDTIIVNHDFGDLEFRNAIDKFNNYKTKSGKIIILHRPWEEGTGLSFKSYNYAFERFHDIYKYWLFMEDDCLIVLDKYFQKFINQIEKDSKVAFIGAGRYPGSQIFDKNGYIINTGNYPAHCHGGVGLTSTKFLNLVYNIDNKLPYPKDPMPLKMQERIFNKLKLNSTCAETTKWYRSAEMGEVEFTNIYKRLGYELQEIESDDPVLFSTQRQKYI